MLHHRLYQQEILRHADAIQELIHIISGKISINIINLIEEFSRPKICIFGKLNPSTLTAQGLLSNVCFHERDLIYAINPSGRIKKMTCNYGESYNKDFEEEKIKIKHTNRGRKPKEKRRNIRKNQGNGKYFNSQLTFWIQSLHIPSKHYKIKLFRNGTIEIPGGLETSMGDVVSAVEVVRKSMGECLAENVNVVELYSIMRNYKFETLSGDIRINISKLYNVFVESYNNKCPELINMTEIKYNIERYPGLIIKFATPIPRNPSKQTTIKMFQSGKVNIDGAISEYCALYYYHWINDFYIKHENSVVYTPNKVLQYSDSDSDSDSGSDSP